MSEVAHMHGLQHFDLTWFAAIHSHVSSTLDWAAAITSDATWAGAFWWLLAAILWLRGHRFFALQLFIALAIGSVEGEVLKHVFHRVRPSVMFPDQVHAVLPDIMQSKDSFPSGHTLLAAAAAFTILYNVRDWRGWLAVAAMLFVGYSRVYEGFHWPTDVIGGAVFGLFATALAVALSQPFARASMFRNRSDSQRVRSVVRSRI